MATKTTSDHYEEPASPEEVRGEKVIVSSQRRFGEVFSLAVCCGLELRGVGAKRSLNCPLPDHDDRGASAVVFGDSNRFHCSVCTPGSSLPFEEFEAVLSGRATTFSSRTLSDQSPDEPQDALRSLRSSDQPTAAAPAKPTKCNTASDQTKETFSTRTHSDRSPSGAPGIRPPKARSSRSCSEGAASGRSHTAPGLRHPAFSTRTSSSQTDAAPEAVTGTFTPSDAKRIWELALARARDDRHAEASEDKLAYRYLAARGLMPAWEESAFGIVTADMELPAGIREWPQRGYHIVAPLYSVESGEITNVQARTIRSSVRPKAIFPAGSKASGAVFADRRGLAVLRGESQHKTVLIGEGMTDYLCLAAHSPIPVLCSAGAGGVRHALGDWVLDKVLLVAVDCDFAGDAVVDSVSGDALYLGSRDVVRVHWPGGAKDACDAMRLLGPERFGRLLDELAPGETGDVTQRLSIS